MGLIDIFKPLSTLLLAALSMNPYDIEKFQRNFLGNAGNRTRGCWVRSKNAIQRSTLPPPSSRHMSLFTWSQPTDCQTISYRSGKLKKASFCQFNLTVLEKKVFWSNFDAKKNLIAAAKSFSLSGFKLTPAVRLKSNPCPLTRRAKTPGLSVDFSWETKSSDWIDRSQTFDWSRRNFGADSYPSKNLFFPTWKTSWSRTQWFANELEIDKRVGPSSNLANCAMFTNAAHS